MTQPEDAEWARLRETVEGGRDWRRFGTYLPERQWGTVREDYSADGSCWEYFPHDHARSRAYRWGEDGLFGLCDHGCRLCFAVALWNGRDAILKERLFGLSNHEGNHGEDVKECYYYLEGTPTHSYMRALYKYPLEPFPYAGLVDENRARSRFDPELELLDTGILDAGRYVDVFFEYAKAQPSDILVALTIENRSSDAAELDLLPTVWFRNTWSWTRGGLESRPKIEAQGSSGLVATHPSLGVFVLQGQPEGLKGQVFTENETNLERLFAVPNPTRYVKDAFHEAIVRGRREACNPAGQGSKAALHYHLRIPPGGTFAVRLRLMQALPAGGGQVMPGVLGDSFMRALTERKREAEAFYHARLPAGLTEAERTIVRQAYAGLCWSKQFYHYVVADWLDGDPGQPAPPEARRSVRNGDWTHFYARDILSVPDRWEYPWFAAWDLAFQAVALARIDPDFAKEQLLLLLREWYSHPSGQLPAYEFSLSDANPPVHAWACYRVYKMTGKRGARDRAFLERAFHKLLVNFTWWVNRKDTDGNHLFSGGFLGLDNIGVFDRSKLPQGDALDQADATAWMAFYCATMLSIALELAREEPVYEDIASKFFEHFLEVADAINTVGGSGLWDEADGFYYDKLASSAGTTSLKIRSMVGIIPLFAVEVLEQALLDRLPGFSRRMAWVIAHRKALASHISCFSEGGGDRGHRLLALPSRERLLRALRVILAEEEFLSPFGIRSLSRRHQEHPYETALDGQHYRVEYVSGASTSGLFGGNSNWRGPIWFPVNYLLIEALERYGHFYGEALRVECPTGSGRLLTLGQVAQEIVRRLGRLHRPDEAGRRPCHGGEARYQSDPRFSNLLLFYEYFDGDSGRGLGASHQTGWTALAARLLEDEARTRPQGGLMNS